MNDIKMKVAAVFASYNRKEVALECVKRLQMQTRPPDLVVVGENASEDGSAEAFENINWDRLIVLNTGDNLGSAGAVELAMKRAYDEGCDWVWILDDDSWPRLDALANLLSGKLDPLIVRHPIQIDPETHKFTWPLQCVDENGSILLAASSDGLPDDDPVMTRGVWTGALISKLAWEKTGPVMGDLFIRGEDEEYPWRMARNGIKQQLIAGSVLDHPGPSGLVSLSLFGKRLFIEPMLARWKLYYKIRNMVWLKKQQHGWLGAITMALAYAWGLSRVDGAHRLGEWWSAAYDGIQGKLGRKDFT